MTFQPFINQLLPDSQHGYLLPNALTLAALGATDSQIRKCRPNLAEGQHFLYQVGSDRIRRLFYTFQGLLELSILLGTDRAKAFREALLTISKADRAITHQPKGDIVTPVRNPPAQHYVQNSLPEVRQPTHLQPSTFESIPPQVFGELLQLKRDELELRRSEQETERFRILQDAYQHQQQLPAGESTATPSHQPHERSGALIENYIITSRTRLLDDPLAVALLLVAFVFLAAIGLVSIAAVAGSVNQREVPGYVK